jgi:ParB family transcriptional regulator, chromosome partitioning protein
MTTLTLPPTPTKPVSNSSRAVSSEAQKQISNPSLTLEPAAVPNRKSESSQSDLLTKLPTSSLLHSRISPRWNFDQQRLNALAESIRDHGVLEPLLVRPVFEFGEKKYEVVIGERRFRAALLAGLEEVPVTVRDLNDEEARRVWMAKTIQREGVNTVEQSEAIMAMLQSSLGLDFAHVKTVLLKMHAEQRERGSQRFLLEGYAGYQMAERVEKILEVFAEISGASGRAGSLSFQSFVTNRLQIFELPGELLEAVRDGRVSLKNAMSLRGLSKANLADLLERHRTERWAQARLKAEAETLLVTKHNPRTALLERHQRIGQLIKRSPNLDADRIAALFDQLEAALAEVALSDAAITEAKIADGALISGL